jgi:hypothetical protein
MPDVTIQGDNGMIGYESIGAVDANMPGWLDIEFGFDKPNRHGSGTWSADLMAVRVDEVFDPRHPGRKVAPPRDLASWLEHHPGLTLAHPSRSIQIGGVAAKQLDLVVGDKDVLLAPFTGVTDPPGFGIGSRGEVRIDVLKVDGHQILLSIGGAPGHGHFERVVAALQPILNSMEWR